MPDLDRLFDQMLALAQADRGLSVFGANAHRWEAELVPTEEIQAFEQAHRITLPEGYRRWIGELAGIGAGPFYGVEALPTGPGPGQPFPHEDLLAAGAVVPDGVDVHDGTIPLAHQGCGYTDHLVVSGPHKGEVWVDFREGGGAFWAWYPSFEAWLTAWLTRSHAEWAAAVLIDHGIPAELEPGFLDCCREALEAVRRADDPLAAQYPVAADRALQALGMLDLAAGRFASAAARFEEAAEVSREPEATRALGQCLVALARDDQRARLAAAEAGLEVRGLWWTTELKLLRHRRFALEALHRWDEALVAVETIAAHASNDLFAQYDLAWVRATRGQVAGAADVLIGAAERGIGCDPDAPLTDRVDQVAAGLVAALRDNGHGRGAAAVEAALADLVLVN